MALRLLSAIALMALAGCAATDPYERAGVWRPDGAVQGDMAAMVADPHDLVVGHGPSEAVGYGGHAVQDLWADHPKALLTNTDSAGAGNGSGAAPQPSGGS